MATRDNALTIGLVLAGIVALLILIGGTLFKPEQKAADATANQTSTELPTTGDHQNAIGFDSIASKGVGFPVDALFVAAAP